MACNLAEQGDIAESKATEVATLVVKPELPLEIASRLYREVEKGAQTFDRILSEMEDADVSDELLEAADALADLWGQLSIASANKLRERQGLPPIMLRIVANSQQTAVNAGMKGFHATVHVLVTDASGDARTLPFDGRFLLPG